MDKYTEKPKYLISRSNLLILKDILECTNDKLLKLIKLHYVNFKANQTINVNYSLKNYLLGNAKNLEDNWGLISATTWANAINYALTTKLTNIM